MSNRRRNYNQYNYDHNGNRNENNNYNYNKQNHVHEVQGSVEIAEPGEDPHNHRFATVSGEAITADGTHCHEVKFRTDTFDGHCHEFCGMTSGAIPVGSGRHVHFLDSVTTENDGHRHNFKCATLIENPTGYEC